jgi:hypothetical protein
VLALTPPDAFATDATISPRGGYVAYVRDQNLHVYDLAGRTDRALTQDGGGTIKNGWRSSSRKRRWAAAAATGGRRTIGTSPSCASTKVR